MRELTDIPFGCGPEVPFSTLVGKSLASIDGMVRGSLVVTFLVRGGGAYSMHHVQDCCEAVQLEDVCGDPSSLLGSPILIARETTDEHETEYGHMTWTFYNIATAKGSVTLRWLGESNGYYSERVSFCPFYIGH